MKIKIIRSPISKTELKEIAGEGFGDMVKAVVDVQKKITHGSRKSLFVLTRNYMSGNVPFGLGVISRFLVLLQSTLERCRLPDWYFDTCPLNR